MPIRPENKLRYPADWPALSLAIRGDRAGWQCECTGQCATRGGRLACFTADFARLCGIGEGNDPNPLRCNAVQNALTHRSVVMGGQARVVLTVAHLDDMPENCDPGNLLAMCQACHLAYDTRIHAANRAESARGDTHPLFDEIR